MPLILLRSQFATYAAQCRSRRAEALRGRKAGGTCRYLSTPFSTPFPLAASYPRLPPPLLLIRCLITNLTQDRDSTFPPFVAAGPAPVADPLAARHNGPRPESIPVYAQRTDNSILSVNPLFHTAKGCAAPSARAAIISLEYVPLSVSRSLSLSSVLLSWYLLPRVIFLSLPISRHRHLWPLSLRPPASSLSLSPNILHHSSLLVSLPLHWRSLSSPLNCVLSLPLLPLSLYHFSHSLTSPPSHSMVPSPVLHLSLCPPSLGSVSPLCYASPPTRLFSSILMLPSSD